MMDDKELDRMLERLGQAQLSGLVTPDFTDGIWLRVGRQGQVRDFRRNALLGLAVIAIGLGAGMGIARPPAKERGQDFALADGAALAPSALLHVTQ